MEIEIVYDMRHVANLLKSIVNDCCSEGFTWFKDIGEPPNMYETLRAIKILDEMGVVGTMKIVDEEDEK